MGIFPLLQEGLCGPRPVASFSLRAALLLPSLTLDLGSLESIYETSGIQMDRMELRQASPREEEHQPTQEHSKEEDQHDQVEPLVLAGLSLSSPDEVVTSPLGDYRQFQDVLRRITDKF